MKVGKDPFPRDEVTGLAAFDHIEPVRALDVAPEDSIETPVLTEESAETAGNLPAHTASANSSQRERADATLPLDLSAMPHWPEASTAASRANDADAWADEAARAGRANNGDDDAEDADVDSAEIDDASNQLTQSAQLAEPVSRPSALDAMFQEAAGAGWDDEDEATRVHSHPAGRGPKSAALDMEWDEEEPATEMRPFAMFDVPPVAARHDWPEWKNTSGATSTYVPQRGTSSIRSATPTIRITTPPLQTELPPPQSRANALSGGRPSPFPTAQLAPASEPAFTGAEERDEARASAFDGLVPVTVPVPAPRLPAAASPLWQSAHERPELHLPQIPARFLDALKAGNRPSIIISAGGFVGLLALVIIVRAIAAGSAGAAVLEVSPADAQVQVDGNPVSGTSSPYTVSELPPGDHEVVVKKAGYNDYRASFAVNAGKSTKLPVIELAATQRDIGFSVRSVPAGAAVWVDGEKTGQVTPAKLTGIKPGIHRLTLKHEGFSDYELQMFVPDATLLQLPAAELVALPAPTPEPTRVGRRSRRALAAEDSDSYSSRRARRAEAADTERSSRSERASYTSSYGSRRSRAADSDDDLSSRSSAPAADSGKTGTLRLNSRPWAQVTVDGRPMGNTPQPNLQLSAGKHKILLSNPQLGVHKSVTVNIKAGETMTQVVNLAE